MQHAGEPDAGRLVGLLAQPAQVAHEAAADADGEHEGEQQGDQAEDAHDGGLGDGADGGRVDPVLVAVGGRVVERGELSEDAVADGVPALGGDARGHLLRVRVEHELLGLAQRCGGGALPEAVVAVAFVEGQLVHADLVHGGALGDQLGDVPQFGAGDPAGDEEEPSSASSRENSSRARAALTRARYCLSSSVVSTTSRVASMA